MFMGLLARMHGVCRILFAGKRDGDVTATKLRLYASGNYVKHIHKNHTNIMWIFILLYATS